MMTLLQRIWCDEHGFVVSSELILITTVLVIGGVVGLSTFREQLVQEFGDVALGLGALNQGYSFAAGTVGGFTVAGSNFIDNSDDCDGPDPLGAEPACLDIGVSASGE